MDENKAVELVEAIQGIESSLDALELDDNLDNISDRLEEIADAIKAVPDRVIPVDGRVHLELSQLRAIVAAIVYKGLDFGDDHVAEALNIADALIAQT